MNIVTKKEDNNLPQLKTLGKLNMQIITMEFGKLQTDKLIVTDERLLHIKAHHSHDYELFEEYGSINIAQPDYIIKDEKHAGTIFMVKKLKNTNLNVIVRLALITDKIGLSNSIMTFYRIREKNLKKLINKNKLLYKK